MATDAIVIAGGGRAAVSLVDAYREAGGEAPVVLLSSDAHPPYNRPPLSKAVLRGEMEPLEALVRPAAEYAERGVELRLGTTVAAIDTAVHFVQLADGEIVPYGTLVIATGARPRMLAIPGGDLPGVHAYRTLDDAVATRGDALSASSAIVVGGSFIGSEVAASLRMLGLDVAVIELGERLVPALSSAELSAQVAALFREQGVELLLGERIEELTGEGGALTGARTASGRTVPGELAVVGVGVVPNVELTEGSGIEVDNGVLVDSLFRTSAPDVYAIGDVARFDDAVTGRRRRIEHHSAAGAQGSHLGRVLAGETTPYAEVPMFFTRLFDLLVQVIGDPDGGIDETVIRGSIAGRDVLGYQLRDGRLVGAVVVGQPDETVGELKALLREQPQVVDRARLADPSLSPAAALA